jgi:hypothetical protein
MLRRTLLLVCAAVLTAAAQKYTGPRPPKPDLPYLKHAENLIPTEAADAKEEKKKDDVLYLIDGANSSAKTPLASPIFLFQAAKLVPDRLQLFKLDSRNGRREILFSSKHPPKAIRIEITRLSSDNLYKIEVDESLEPGEYSLSPEGSNQVFCFQVF